MKKEEKEILLKDLCGRLSYGIKCSFGVDDAVYEITGINPTCCGASEIQATHVKSSINGDFRLNSCKPYLFPMSSMTKKQKDYIRNRFCYEWESDEEVSDLWKHKLEFGDALEFIQWCYENHLDINSFIPKGLATDATGKNIYQL